MNPAQHSIVFDGPQCATGAALGGSFDPPAAGAVTRSKRRSVRLPNSGPYIVTYWRWGTAGVSSRSECHTWLDACVLMRSLLVDGYACSVEFA